MRFTVRMKMILGFGLILASLLTISGFAYVNLTTIQTVLSNITKVVSPTVQAGNRLVMTLWEANTVAEEYLDEDELIKLDTFTEEFEALTATYNETNSRLKKLSDGAGNLLDDLQGADAEFQEFVTQTTAMFAAHRLELEKEQTVQELTQTFENAAVELRKSLEEMAVASEQAFQATQAMTDFKTVEATLKLSMIVTEALEISREYLASENSIRLAAIRKEFVTITALSDEFVVGLQESANTAQEKTDVALLADLIVQFNQVTLDEAGLFDKYQEFVKMKTTADKLAGVLELDANSTVEVLNSIVEATEKGENLITIVWEANKVAQQHLVEIEDDKQLDAFEQEFETLVKNYQAADEEMGQEIGSNPDLNSVLERADQEFEVFSLHVREIFTEHRKVVEQARTVSEQTQAFEGIAEELKAGLDKLSAFREQQFKMAQEMSVNNYNAVEATLKLSKLIGDALETVRECLTLRNPEKLPDLLEEFNAIAASTDEYEQQLLDAMTVEQEKIAVQQLITLITEFEGSTVDEDELFDEYQEQLEAEYQADALTEELEKHVASAVRFLNQVVQTTDELSAGADTQAAETIERATFVIGGLTALAVVVGLFITIVITNGIVKALRKGVDFAESIANGDLTTNITIKSHDEVGDLTRALKAMQMKIGQVMQEMTALIQAIQDGRLDIRGNADMFTGGWQELISGVNNVVDAFMTPFNVVSVHLDRMAKGDMPPQITEDYRGDFIHIKDNLNQLVQSLSDIIGQISSGTNVLLDTVQDLSTSSQEISSTSNQQAAAVKEIVSTMEDSDQLTRSITTKIGEVTDMTASTKSSVDDGFSVLQNSLKQMEVIKNSNAETITEMRALGDGIASIWDIVSMINEIAGQTKIIAFNAELEASSAGDAGKNFQIVASEIRRLADGTVASTSDIKTKINEIQQSSDQLIITSEEGTVKIQEGWELSKNLQQLFENVLESADVSSSATEQIALSIKQQASAFTQILQTLKQISEGVESFVSSTTATTQASQKLQEIADGLHSVLENFTGKPEDNEETPE